MLGLKIIYRAKNNIFLTKPEMVSISPEEILKGKIAPFVFYDDYDLMEFRVNKKVIKGIAVGFDEVELEMFKRRYAVEKEGGTFRRRMGRRMGRIGRRMRKDFEASSGTIYLHEEEVVFYKKGESEFMFLHADSSALVGWSEFDGKIKSVLCGYLEDRYESDVSDRCNYFYYSGYSTQNGIAYLKFVRSPDLIPDEILNSVKLHISIERYHFRSNSLKGSTSELIDLLPFPPYRVVYAIKLLPPERLEGVEEAPLPPGFDGVYVVRTFLLLSEFVQVTELSPSQMKTLISYLHGDIFDSGVRCENPMGEYRQLYSFSAGYLLLCEPEFSL